MQNMQVRGSCKPKSGEKFRVLLQVVIGIPCLLLNPNSQDAYLLSNALALELLCSIRIGMELISVLKTKKAMCLLPHCLFL